MASTGRAARSLPASPANTNPNRIMQVRFQSPRGEVRGWFKGGECYRVRVTGVTYGRGEALSVWAAVQNGSFRPADFGRHNQ